MAREEESSSGCQSGWTVYFDQSYLAPPPLSGRYSKDSNRFELSREEETEVSDEEEEEDLSMVSDASSGPPHFDTEEQHSECGTLLLLSERRKKRKVDRLSDTKRDFCSSLDDTASSPMLNLNHSIVCYPIGFWFLACLLLLSFFLFSFHLFVVYCNNFLLVSC